MAISWIEYKGKKILYADYRHLTDKLLAMQQLEEQKKMVESVKEKVLILSDYRDMYAFDEFVAKVKQYGKEHKHRVEKIGVLGIHGIKKVFFNAYVTFTGDKTVRAFDTEEQAKEYLVGP